MNKTLGSIALAALITLGFTGCGDKAPEPKVQEKAQQEQFDDRCKIDGTLAPEWVCGNGFIEGTAYTASGSAAPNPLGYGNQRREALANARSNLAQQMETLVKDKVENFARVTGVGDAAVADKVSTQVSKQAAKVSLRGSKQMKSWQHPKNKDLYVLVGVPKKAMNNGIKNQVANSYKNDEALWQQFQSKNALEDLEKEFQ